MEIFSKKEQKFSAADPGKESKRNNNKRILVEQSLLRHTAPPTFSAMEEYIPKRSSLSDPSRRTISKNRGSGERVAKEPSVTNIVQSRSAEIIDFVRAEKRSRVVDVMNRFAFPPTTKYEDAVKKLLNACITTGILKTEKRRVSLGRDLPYTRVAPLEIFYMKAEEEDQQ